MLLLTLSKIASLLGDFFCLHGACYDVLVIHICVLSYTSGEMMFYYARPYMCCVCSYVI